MSKEICVGRQRRSDLAVAVVNFGIARLTRLLKTQPLMSPGKRAGGGGGGGGGQLS